MCPVHCQTARKWVELGFGGPCMSDPVGIFGPQATLDRGGARGSCQAVLNGRYL